LFDHTVPDDRIVSTLEDLDLGSWFRNLPDGLDTEIATGSSSLSAGEAQLLAFTRVFLKDPGLVILDEPSSRLDPATERKINHAVERLLENRPGIIIAHRLDTVEKVDDILILEAGEIQEHGRRADLVQDQESQFSILLRAALEAPIG
jgi:ATP-binding cassette subfamily B protein